MNRVPRWMFALLLLQLARLAVGACFELVPQEAYYVFYARHPALSYFDHPGALAWLLFLPAQAHPPPPIAIRLVPFLLAAVTLAGVVQLARRFVPPSAGPGGAAPRHHRRLHHPHRRRAPRRRRWSLPGLGVSASWPGRCSTASGGRGSPPGSPRGWPSIRSTPGGSSSSVRGCCSSSSRGEGRRCGPSIPGWGSSPRGWSPRRCGSGTPARLGLLPLPDRGTGASTPAGSRCGTPPRSSAASWHWCSPRCSSPLDGWRCAGCRRWPGALEEEELFLAVFSVVPAVLFLAVSLGAVVKPNWPFPLWIAGALWTARRVGPWLLPWNAAASAVLHVVALVELFGYPVRLGDDTWVGWRELTAQTRSRLAPGEFAFSADDYKTTAELLLDGTVEAYGRNLLGEPALQFDWVGLDVRRAGGAERVVPRLGSAAVRRCAVRPATGDTPAPLRAGRGGAAACWCARGNASCGGCGPGAAWGSGRPKCCDPGVLTAPTANPLAATRSLVAALLDVPRGTPPRLTPRVRRLASVSAVSPWSPSPGRSPSARGACASARRRGVPGARHRPGCSRRRRGRTPPARWSRGTGRLPPPPPLPRSARCPRPHRR